MTDAAEKVSLNKPRRKQLFFIFKNGCLFLSYLKRGRESNL